MGMPHSFAHRHLWAHRRPASDTLRRGAKLRRNANGNHVRTLRFAALVPRNCLVGKPFTPSPAFDERNWPRARRSCLRRSSPAARRLAHRYLRRDFRCSRHREAMRSREINNQSLSPAIGIQCIVRSFPKWSASSHKISNRGLGDFISG